MRECKYNINLEEFINPTKKEYVYILGLLWADGYIYKSGSVSLMCKDDDSKNICDLFLRTGNWKITKIEKYLKKNQ